MSARLRDPHSVVRRVDVDAVRWVLVCITRIGVYLLSNTTVWWIDIQSGPVKCIHSLLINIFGINLNEVSVSG